MLTTTTERNTDDDDEEEDLSEMNPTWLDELKSGKEQKLIIFRII